MTTIARGITGGSTHTSTPTWRPPSTNEVPARRPELCRHGRRLQRAAALAEASAPSNSSASKERQLRGRAHPTPAGPPGLRRRSGQAEPPASSSHRQVRPEDAVAAARAAREETPPVRPRPGTETSRPCGYCGGRSSASEAGPRPSIRCAVSSRPLRGAPAELRISPSTSAHRLQRLSPHRTDRRCRSDQDHLAHAGPTGHLSRRGGEGDRPDAEDPCR